MQKKQAIMDLVGRVAMVDPELNTRPPSRKGECCIIQDIQSKASGTRIYVNFEDGKIDYFTPDHLLILRSKKDILQNLVTATGNITKEQYKECLNILHLEAGGHHKMALTMAISSDFYRKQCIIPCMEWVIQKEHQRLKKFKHGL